MKTLKVCDTIDEVYSDATTEERLEILEQMMQMFIQELKEKNVE